MAKQNLILTTYTRTAPTVNALKEALDCRRIYNDTTQVAVIPEVCLIVNFGSSRLNRALRAPRAGWKILNRPERIQVCASKVLSFQAFRAANIVTPMISRDRHEATRWLNQDGLVLVREDGGHQGEGITVARTVDQLNAADGDFFSKFLPKTHEFRFHVWGNEVIDLIERRHRAPAGNGGVIPEVFNHNNGYLFYRNNINIQPHDRTEMGQMAINAVRALQMDFGAVDILARYENGRLVGYAVCEVNSAPALEGDDAKRPYIAKIMEEWRRHVNVQPAQPAAGGNAINRNAWG